MQTSAHINSKKSLSFVEKLNKKEHILKVWQGSLYKEVIWMFSDSIFRWFGRRLHNIAASVLKFNDFIALSVLNFFLIYI